MFKEWYVHVRQPTTGYQRSSLGPAWYPDALMPQRTTELFSSVPFSIPDLYNNIPGQRIRRSGLIFSFPMIVLPRLLGGIRVSWR